MYACARGRETSYYFNPVDPVNQQLLDTIRIKEIKAGFRQLLILSNNNRLFICGDNSKGRKYSLSIVCIIL
jgi:alpha-tubulin suppressor-like RCC1 family protein